VTSGSLAEQGVRIALCATNAIAPRPFQSGANGTLAPLWNGLYLTHKLSTYPDADPHPSKYMTSSVLIHANRRCHTPCAQRTAPPHQVTHAAAR
jgi:hypothetical protein